MIASTIAPALFAVVLIYLVVIRLIPWRRFSYGFALAMGAALISVGRPLTDYAGLEIAVIGCFVTWLDPMGYFRPET